MISAEQALQRLQAGNQRFVSGQMEAAQHLGESGEVTAQQPFAIVLGCSDSRVPAELVFDQGLGDLFVIRVAGNIVASSQIASIEFAAEAFGTQLVVVLGHTHCGAVKATLAALDAADDRLPGSLGAIVDRVRPAVESVMASDIDPSCFLASAVRENIRHSVQQLQTSSRLLRDMVEQRELQIVGAQYDLKTRRVEFLD